MCGSRQLLVSMANYVKGNARFELAIGDTYNCFQNNRLKPLSQLPHLIPPAGGDPKPVVWNSMKTSSRISAQPQDSCYACHRLPLRVTSGNMLNCSRSAGYTPRSVRIKVKTSTSCYACRAQLQTIGLGSRATRTVGGN